jgi:hypothetical protein
MSLTSWVHSGLSTSDHKPHATEEKGPGSSESGASYAQGQGGDAIASRQEGFLRRHVSRLLVRAPFEPRRRDGPPIDCARLGTSV